MSLQDLRLVFMGTPEFSIPALEALLSHDMNVVVAYTQPPRPKGRNYHAFPSPVHQYAESRGIPVFTPLSLKSPQDQENFSNLKPDLVVVVAYGLILPEAILSIPRYGCLNIHGSILPRWRGAAPIQRAIEAGDHISGVTIMKMDKGMDTGPVLAQESWVLEDKVTSGDLFSSMAQRGADLLVKTIPFYISGKISPQEQSKQGVIYADKITKEEAQLDWHKPAVELERKIRAFNPHPGAWFLWHGERFKVYEADVIKNISEKPGTLLDTKLTIACGQDALQLKVIQKPGGKPMKAQDYLRGSHYDRDINFGVVLDP